MRTHIPVILVSAVLCAAGCYATRPSNGGGQTAAPSERSVNPSDVLLPAGYRIEAVATGLNMPTGVAFDERGGVYVTESGYSYGEIFSTPRLVRVNAGGAPTAIATGERPPWTGVAYRDGAFYVAEGGAGGDGGAIVRIDRDGGRKTVLVDHLPSVGDHHTNGPVVGADGAIYFAVGTATNSGVVGEDDADFGWLKRHPEFHDIPGRDITLVGENFTTDDALHPGQKAVTGAYLPYGTASHVNQVIKGQVPCTGGVFRIGASAGSTSSPEAGKVELVAWGLRNPFGLAVSPEGRLYVAENSYDVRGSRPVFGTGDLLWRIEPGTWYGWPDYYAGVLIGNPDRFQAPFHSAPRPLLASHPQEPPRPVAKFGVHASACGFDFSRGGSFGYAGEAFVAEFGDMAPAVGKVIAPVGFKVVRVDVRDGVVHDFAVNRGEKNGPASRAGTGGLERPIAARFSPDGNALYVVDFGIMTMDGKRPRARENTGVLWRITRGGG